MSFSDLPWLGILAGTLATFLLGVLWYSPLLFGRAWQRMNGLDDATLARDMGVVFGGAFMFAFISAITMAFFLGPNATASFGAAAGAATGLGWVAPGLVTTSAPRGTHRHQRGLPRGLLHVDGASGRPALSARPSGTDRSAHQPRHHPNRRRGVLVQPVEGRMTRTAHLGATEPY